jgi:tetratricopeptide (TPR) repeat protein
MLKGARGLDPHANVLRAAVLCAVGCVLAHSFGDSDLYYPGMAVITFLLMGAGLCLSADGVAPEVLPASLRSAGCALGAVIVVTLGYFALGEYLRASLRGAAVAGDRERVQAITRTLTTAYPADGETWRFAAAYAPESAKPAAKLNFLRRAARIAPTTSNLRALAIAQMERNPADAVAPLREALGWDPNNLPTLKLTVQAEERAGRIEDAVATARRLVAVEGTPYFQVRALPQLVPTETFWAREWLAAREPDVHKRIELLQGAVDGYLRYARTTLPQVRQADRTGVPIAGESLEQAQGTIRRARDVALELASLYRALGRLDEARRAETAAEELGTAAT